MNEDVVVQITETAVLGNELWRYGMLFLSIFIGYAIGKIASYFICRLAKRLHNNGGEVGAGLTEAFGNSLPFITLVIGAAVGVRFLNLIPAIDSLINTLLHVLGTIAVGALAWRLVEVATAIFQRRAEKTASTLDDSLVPILRTSLRVTVVILIFVQIAQILSDKPITSIIAGLGIGGLAVALAAQDSLKNVFGSVMIFADKPFQVGDRIVVNGFDGPVEEVGLRSTRIRTLTGHLVTIPNGELANKSIENISKRPYIRRIMNVTIPFDTPPEKVEQAIQILKDILAVKQGEGGRTDNGHIDEPGFEPRVVFNDITPSAFNLMMIYWYFPPAYWDFMGHSEWLHLTILRRFNEAGIEFAFPTQTVYLAGDEKRPLDIRSRKLEENNDAEA